MKLIIVFLLISIGTAHSQSWIPTDTLPSVSRYDDIYFISDETGWAVNSNGSIFKTTNGGDDWRNVFEGAIYLRSIEFINDSIGFAGSLQKAFLRTTDAGENWYHIEDSISYPIDGICGLSHAGDHVFGVGAYDSPAYFIKSVNKGVNWTYHDMSQYCNALVDCYFIDEQRGFVSGSDYDDGPVILKTTDGGETWENVFSVPGTFSFVWKIFFVTPSVAYASIEASNGDFQIAKTIDGGDEWSLIQGPPGDYDIQGIGFETPLHGWVSPRHSGLFETKDGGMTWDISQQLPNINRFFQVPGGRFYASGSKVYLYGNVTGIGHQEEPVQSHKLTVHPNPFSSQFTIEARLDMHTDVLIGIGEIDVGNFIILYKGRLNEGIHTLDIDPIKFSIPEGQVLLVVLATDEGFLTEKVVRAK
jgi:photosystem II stability/assembly factor-like uncharacterized protein